MKKILIFLLISTLAYAFIEESNEYDKVSLELSKDTYKTTVHLDKSNPTRKPTSKPTSKLTKSNIMKTKHPFKEIKGRLL